MDKGRAAGDGKIVPQSGETVNRSAVGEFGLGVDGSSGQVTIAEASDRVEIFQREAERIELDVAGRTAGVAAVPLDQLSHGEPLRPRFALGKPRHVFRRLGQLFAEEHFAYPIAP